MRIILFLENNRSFPLSVSNERPKPKFQRGRTSSFRISTESIEITGPDLSRERLVFGRTGWIATPQQGSSGQQV